MDRNRDESPFLIRSLPGYQGAVGQLVYMMNYARLTTLAEVRSLTTFKWFHVLEDEVNHRGQIRIIRRRLPSAQN